MIQLEH
ncbi:hypothetical protein D046_6383A, partial [Vibrio parahaemolyticus V-223/04]